MNKQKSNGSTSSKSFHKLYKSLGNIAPIPCDNSDIVTINIKCGVDTFSLNVPIGCQMFYVREECCRHFKRSKSSYRLFYESIMLQDYALILFEANEIELIFKRAPTTKIGT